MEMQEMEICIEKDGTIRIAVSGTSGNRCLAMTKGLEEALGTLTQRTFTAPYYEQEISPEEQLSIGRKRV